MSVGLGASHNYVHIADSAIVDMQQCESVTVYTYESSAEAVTSLKRRLNGGSPAVFPDVITEYFTCTGDGSDAWVRNTQSAADEVTKAADADESLCAIEVYAEMLKSDGGDYNELEVEVDGSAVVSLVLNGLKVQRAPQNLPKTVG